MAQGMLASVIGAMEARLGELGEIAVRRGGIPPSWFSYRWVTSETVRAWFERHRWRQGRFESVHAPSTAFNAMPCNIVSCEVLPDDRGWWGYSFRDVPTRRSGETFIATLPDCRVVPFRDTVKNNFWVGVLNNDGRALDLREFHFRSGHVRVLRSTKPEKRKRATWVVERVYHNYSHWLTAHLPKFLLLRGRPEFDDVLLPPNRPAFVDASLRLLGIEPTQFETFDPARVLDVEALTLIGNDRFHPELLRSVHEAVPLLSSRARAGPDRKIFISRQHADRRRLANEAEIWPLLARRGFERVTMEALDFEAQVALMQETAVLVAPHGAGLTNMMFCAPGTHVVEIADLGFPNPNFYAVAAGMRHHYWLVQAQSLGDSHPLEKDLMVDSANLENCLDRCLEKRLATMDEGS